LKADNRMYNVLEELPKTNPGEIFSAWNYGNATCAGGGEGVQYSLIDHILISPGLRKYVAGVQLLNKGWPADCKSYYSFHWPVVLELDFSK